MKEMFANIFWSKLNAQTDLDFYYLFTLSASNINKRNSNLGKEQEMKYERSVVLKRLQYTWQI